MFPGYAPGKTPGLFEQKKSKYTNMYQKGKNTILCRYYEYSTSQWDGESKKKPSDHNQLILATTASILSRVPRPSMGLIYCRRWRRDPHQGAPNEEEPTTRVGRRRLREWDLPALIFRRLKRGPGTAGPSGGRGTGSLSWRPGTRSRPHYRRTLFFDDFLIFETAGNTI